MIKSRSWAAYIKFKKLIFSTKVAFTDQKTALIQEQQWLWTPISGYQTHRNRIFQWHWHRQKQKECITVELEEATFEFRIYGVPFSQKLDTKVKLNCKYSTKSYNYKMTAYSDEEV